MSKIYLKSKDRIKMFINEYYFGQNYGIMLMRLLVGPILFLIGLGLYLNAPDKFGIAYSGICMAYSLYYIFRPFIWVAFRWGTYKDIEFDVELSSDTIQFKGPQSSSEMSLTALRNVFKRKTYYALELDKHVKVYLPVNSLSLPETEILEQFAEGSQLK